MVVSFLIYFTFNFKEALLLFALSLAYITSVVPFFCGLILIVGSVAKLKLYAHLYKTIKANIVLTGKRFVSINYFSFFSINII
ncbi:hypothetical protein AL503_000665 [Staphylococcus haemolyticus]|uniref:Uncharacterized protein n=1 Tax=Staphylococcus haemolyticus TaxID=1283 RepID=A0A2K0AXV6_STAHA|nr:hypothetical protein AL503_000665 [Staphylococcus haemolyticus]